MSDNQIDVRISAESGPLKRGMDDAVAAVEASAARMRTSFANLGDEMKAHIGKVTALMSAVVVGAIAMGKSAIDAEDDLNDMSQRLGISVENLAGLKLAAESSGMTLESMASGVKKLSVYMSQHADKLVQVGITSKDTNEAMIQMADLFASMPDGAQKTALAMQLMGRSGADMIPLLNGGGEALRQMIERGRELYPVTTEMAHAADEFNDRVQELKVGVGGLQIQFANALLPTLNQLTSAWAENAKQIGIVNGSLVALGQLGPVGQTIGVLWANVSYVFKAVGTEIGGIAAQLAALARFDFKQAGLIGDMMKRDAKDARAELDDLERRIMGLSGKAASKAPALNTGGGSTPDLNGIIGGGSAKSKAGGKQVSDAEWAMEEAAHLTRTYHQIGEERAAAEEASFDRATKFAEDWEADLDRANQGVAADAKKTAEQRLQVEYAWSQNAAAARLAVVDADQAQARYAVEIGSMTKEELLAQELQFEQRRNEIRQQALQDRLALIDPEKDPVAYAQTLIALEELERQHQQAVTAIKQQAALEQTAPMRNAMQGIETSMAQSMQKLMQGQMSLAGFMKSLWNGVVSAIIGEIAKMAAAWIMNKVKMLIFGKASALSEIATLSARAGAGGVASFAAAPWPINMGAPAFGAAMSAAAMAFAPVAAASGGYDIPAGINPVTQLHQREMVLPAHIADPLRQSLDEGGGMGGGSMTVNISAVDGQSVRRLFMDHGPALADAIKAQVRGFRT